MNFQPFLRSHRECGATCCVPATPAPAMLTLLTLMAVLAMLVSALPAAADTADTFVLTDEPGNWFQAESTGTPVTFLEAGDRLDFVINGCCTDTRHTATLLLKPAASQAELDQDQSKKGTLSVDLDVPGVYIFVCKIHPYMTAVAAVVDDNGLVPDVSAEVLPFLEHLGLDSLDPQSVLDVITTIAPDEAEKEAKWDLFAAGDPELTTPEVPGVGEVWIDTQFESVPGQPKPGTITVVDAETFAVEREIYGGLDPDAAGMWNNPHNMWADFAHEVIYNTNWFGRWLNKIDRESGDVLESIEVGEAPTHVITDPDRRSGEFGVLHIPLSAEDHIAKVRDDRQDGLKKIDQNPTGDGRTHPHGHWLQCGSGKITVVANVFNGLGFSGSVSLIDTSSGDVIEEFPYDADDPISSAFLMPLAVGECHVDIDGEHVHKAYVGNVVTGLVTVLDIEKRQLLKNIPVTLTPDEQTGLDLFHTLQLPIQAPVSPDGRWVAVAVFSLTTVDRESLGTADHVAIIDTTLDEVVAWVGTPAGTHGINWGAKLGGGYYAWVTNQHSNVVTVVDPDPNNDGDGSDAAAVGQVLLANDSSGAGVTDGTGGQGVKPLPMTHDGWIQPAVFLTRQGRTSPEVREWIRKLTPEQRNPD